MITKVNTNYYARFLEQKIIINQFNNYNTVLITKFSSLCTNQSFANQTSDNSRS